MNKLVHHLTTMAYNNAWANHRLLTAVAQLPHDEFVKTRTSFFPSIKKTLNHIVTVDWYYVDAIERGLAGKPVNPKGRAFFDVAEPFDSCAELMVAQRKVDRRLIAACISIHDDQVDTPIALMRRAGVQREGATRLLSHLFQHQIHHRGQVHAMLAGTAVAPPQLDEFFCANEEHLRAKELEELGYSEAHIWGDVLATST